jgi:hypothetical protein
VSNVCHIIFKFVPEDLLNEEHNAHNLEMYGILRKQTQVETLWNEITNSDGSLDRVGAMTRLLDGGQRNDYFTRVISKVLHTV